MNLKGKVKSIKEKFFEAVEKIGDIEKGNRKRENDSHTMFNYQGNEIEENGFDADGSLIYKNTYKYDYDNKGNWIKQIIF